jgi:hypothetical protein
MHMLTNSAGPFHTCTYCKTYTWWIYTKEKILSGLQMSQNWKPQV